MEEYEGHIHAELMAKYAEDARTHKEPWNNFQWRTRTRTSTWSGMLRGMQFESKYEFRYKPKTHNVNGIEIPDLRVKSFNAGTLVGYCVDPLAERLCREHWSMVSETTERFLGLGILYEHTEEGKQAAILHAKAWLGI